MNLPNILYSVKKSNHGKLDVFADGKKLLSLVKKKGKDLSKADLRRLRRFLEVDGNTRLLNVKDDSFTLQKEAVLAVARDMAQEDGDNMNKCYALCNDFMRVLTSHYEQLEHSRQLEKISSSIFSRKIKEDKRFRLLEKSHNPLELYELGEICLKTEDYFDPLKAQEFYDRAAQEGINDGWFTLGLYYELDEKNFEKAREFYERLVEAANPKGYSGLSILFSDGEEGNPYYDPEKAREMAQTGYDQRCGTSIFLLSRYYMEDQKTRGFDLALEASQCDGNLEAQLHSCEAFVQSLAANLSRNYPAFVKAFANAPALYKDLVVYLYASKYNMSENYGRFLKALLKLVEAVESYYTGSRNYTKTQILKGIGFSEELIQSLTSQYARLDEASQEAAGQVLDLLRA